MTELVYIGGYGRSGSTLLESLLTTRPDVLACGEVACCLRERVDRGCTCGKSRQDCAVWGAFYKTPDTLQGWTHDTLTLALLDSASGQYGFLVDSSKTAWGSLSAPFRLRRKLGARFHLIHVVRNPKGVCWSSTGGAWQRRAVIKSRFLRYVRTSAGWWAANLSCEGFGRLYPTQYQRVRYEDLARAHVEVLERLFAALIPQGSAPPPGAQTDGNRHQLYGNQSRYNRFTPSKVREDIRWTTEMPAPQRSLVAALTWPLRLRYGY